MADFSRHGGPAGEWVELTKTTAIPTGELGLNQTVVDLQRATNEDREKASAAYMQDPDIQEKIYTQDFNISTRDGGSLPTRIYRPKRAGSTKPLPVYLHFHGGGYLFGTLSGDDASCTKIALSVDVVVVNACYRHTPQYQHPAQANDGWDAFEWTLSHMGDLGGDPHRLIVGGISAGAGLACSVVLRENHSSSHPSRIQGLILGIPWLQHPSTFDYDLICSKEKSSYFQNHDAPILPRARIDLFADLLGVTDLRDASIFPGNATEQDVVGFPKTAFLVAGMDVLRDEAFLFEEKLKKNGVRTRLEVFDGLPHGFFRYASLPSTRRWHETIEASIKWALE